MKVWVTKYALTRGIMEVEVRLIRPDMVEDAALSCMYYFGNEWHRIYKLAVLEANRMRTRKLDSLRKQVVRLENTEFK